MKACTVVLMPDHGEQIGVVAQRHGVSPATLRYYEEVGLLPAPNRTPAGYRIYDDRHDERLRFIAKAKDLDLSLEEICLLLDARDVGGCHDTRKQLRHAVAHKVLDARRRATEALQFADQLTHVYEELATSVPAPREPCDESCRCVPELPSADATSLDEELSRIGASSCTCTMMLRAADHHPPASSASCGHCSDVPTPTP